MSEGKQIVSGKHTEQVIGPWEYREDHSLVDAEIADGVTEIGDCAFYGCPKLRRVSIPASVERIGKNPFDGCEELESVYIRPGNACFEVSGGILYSAKDMRLVCCPRRIAYLNDTYQVDPGVKIIGDHAFSGAPFVRIDLPDTLEEIGENAFSFTKAESFRVPGSVSRIGYGAFMGCAAMEEITLEDGIREIGDYAFDNCGMLEEITLPDSIGKVGKNPFRFCAALKTIRISPDHPRLRFEGGVLYDMADHRVICTAPAGFTTGHYVLPDGITEIGSEAFQFSRRLRAVSLGNGLEEIGYRAFAECTGIKRIVIPESVRKIGAYAFHNCKELKRVHIPETVELGYKGV